ncbi:hypothetical protein RRG08_061787 [Elysia crispata]|uniref:Lipid-binding serum glycoprotein N-terminal domain-containing protein n=1 Tax=Elysia crispata TaxID=231223 RepID=A0AAE1AEP6_9GAST|nr:hypothetical protein RRG08_061787 [Elysia crispata]
MMLRFAVIFLLVGAELCASKNPGTSSTDCPSASATSAFYSISNPTNRVSLRPHGSGLTCTLSNLGISANANYRAVKGGWIHISNHGRISASLRDVSISETVTFGWSHSSGRPTISHRSCSSRINSVGVRFYGRWAWLINLFRRRLSRRFKDMLQSK